MNLAQMRNVNRWPGGLPAHEVDRVEAHFGTPFPKGYREIMTRFGVGVVNDYLRFYEPKRIIEELDSEFRSRWEEYFFWDENPELTKEQVLQSIIFADTIYGDELIFLPGDPDAIYLLARHDYGLPRIGADIPEAVAHLFKDDPNAGAVMARPYFQAFGLKTQVHAKAAAADVFGQVRDIVLAKCDLDVLTDENGVEDKEDGKIFFLHGFSRASTTQVKLLWNESADDSGLLEFAYTQSGEAPAADMASVLAALEAQGFQRNE